MLELKRGGELLSIEQISTTKGPVFIGFVDEKPVAVSPHNPMSHDTSSFEEADANLSEAKVSENETFL